MPLSEDRPSPRDLGKSVAYFGNRLINLEKKIDAEVASLRKEMGQMFEHFETQRLREEFGGEAKPVSEDDTIPYEPPFDNRWAEDRWRRRHRAWRESIIPHLEGLVCAGEDEHGVPILADFEVQLTLPVVYLLTAGRQRDRYAWMRENPYEEWRKQWAEEK